MSPDPLVSIVVVCLNQVVISRQCLQSLFHQDYPNFEVIVVDNGSHEPLSEMVSTEYPRARLIRLEQNLGISAGFNIAMQAGSGEYFAMLNNDVVAEPSWVRVMVEAAETDPSIGMVAPVIKDGNIQGVFDSYGLGLAMDGMSRQRWNGLNVPIDLVPEEPLLVSGCACLFRADAVRELGYLDEDFFGYCEDSDLGLRLVWAGLRAVAVPGTSVTHFYSQTLGKFNPKKVFWIERNHFWITIKSFPLPLLMLVPWFTFYRYLLQVYVILFGIGELSGYVTGGNGRSSIVKVILQAYLSFLQGLPLMLRKRRQIMRSARRGSWEMTRLIWQNRLPMLEILTGAAKLPRR